MVLHTEGRGFIFRILRYIMILRFHLETTYLDNNEYYYIFLNKSILHSVTEGIK